MVLSYLKTTVKLMRLNASNKSLNYFWRVFSAANGLDGIILL